MARTRSFSFQRPANEIHPPTAVGLVVFFRGATKYNLAPPQVAQDCVALGLSEEATECIKSRWEANCATLASNQVTKTVMANQVVDMEWKFGVTAASNQVAQVGSTFLHLKLVIDRGNGHHEDVFMELALPQFYQFMAAMQKAKTHLDHIAE